MVISWREVFFPWSPKISDFWGEQRPWSPADLIGVPRELCSNGERRSDGALYFGMPKSFSEIRDDEFVPHPNASAKVLLFFDMAMGWSGLRAVLVRIACMCPNDWAKQEKNTRSNRSNLGNHY